MRVLLVVNTPPYGNEGPYNAFRLADALAPRGEQVDVFLMGDGVVESDLVEGVTLATIHDLAEAVVRCERTLSF